MQLRSRRSTPPLPEAGCLRQPPHHTLKKRRSSTGQQRDGSELPCEILYLLAGKLSCSEDVAAASAVCKSWAKHLRAGLSTASLHIGSDSICDSLDDCAHPVVNLANISPGLSELQVVVNGRSNYESLQEVVSTVHMLPLKTLRLSFVVSPTPKKGGWPMFFADTLNIGKTPRLVVDGSSMPDIAVTSLLSKLSANKHLKSLELLVGRPTPGSQLPAFKAPLWMTSAYFEGVRPTAINKEQLELVCKLTGLEHLELTPEVNSITSPSFKGFSKLKSLTSIVINGTQNPSVLQRLAQLKQLRKVQVEVRFDVVRPDNLDTAALEHVQEVDIGLSAANSVALHLPLNNKLDRLSNTLRHQLKGLSLKGFVWHSTITDHLTALSGLSSLQLLNVKPAVAANSAQMDLTPLGKLTNIQKFALGLATGMEPITAIRFGVHPEQQSGRRSSAGGQSTSKRGSKKQKTPSTRDMSGLAKVWPNLQSLQISGVAPSAASDTNWDFRQLPGLTSLCLRFTPTVDAVTDAAVQAAALGVSGPDSPAFLEAVTVKLQLSHMPRELKQLQLTGCSLLVPYCTPFSEHLTSLSLSHCWLQRNWDPQLQHTCSSPAASTPAPETPASTVTITTPTTPSSAVSKHLWEPLVVLLRDLPELQQLELVNMHHTQVHDGLLAAAAAACPDATTRGMSLRALTSLSVLGVGNQALSNGGLLGLTSLHKLRMLRWHVGDALELIPDVGALAKMQGLVALHVPVWLNAQMERWGAYAVLDSLPLCDVHVEAV